MIHDDTWWYMMILIWYTYYWFSTLFVAIWKRIRHGLIVRNKDVLTFNPTYLQSTDGQNRPNNILYTKDSRQWFVTGFSKCTPSVIGSQSSFMTHNWPANQPSTLISPSLSFRVSDWSVGSSTRRVLKVDERADLIYFFQSFWSFHFSPVWKFRPKTRKSIFFCFIFFCVCEVKDNKKVFAIFFR